MDWNKAAKVIRLLHSPNEGERKAAIAALGRLDINAIADRIEYGDNEVPPSKAISGGIRDTIDELFPQKKTYAELQSLTDRLWGLVKAGRLADDAQICRECRGRFVTTRGAFTCSPTCRKRRSRRLARAKEAKRAELRLKRKNYGSMANYHKRVRAGEHPDAVAAALWGKRKT